MCWSKPFGQSVIIFLQMYLSSLQRCCAKERFSLLISFPQAEVECWQQETVVKDLDALSCRTTKHQPLVVVAKENEAGIFESDNSKIVQRPYKRDTWLRGSLRPGYDVHKTRPIPLLPPLVTAPDKSNFRGLGRGEFSSHRPERAPITCSLVECLNHQT